MSLASATASLLGTRLTLFIGPTLAVPAPILLTEALSAVEVSLSDEGVDGFTLTFTVGRSSVFSLDYAILSNPLLKIGNRVVIQVWLGVVPQVLIDGFITKVQLNPSDEPGQSTLTITGEDLRHLMDLHEVSMSFLGLPVEARVALILAKYALYLGRPPNVVRPLTSRAPLPSEQIPAQANTDLKYLNTQAKIAGYVFYVEPTPVPMVNMAYWGPKLSLSGLSTIQSALSINMGSETNATVRFDYDGRTPKTVLGAHQDKLTGLIVPVVTVASLRPPLVPLQALLFQQPHVRSVMARNLGAHDPLEAMQRAQELTENSSDAVTAHGELDMLRYGDILRPRRRVGLRGAGWNYDGLYYVNQVTHSIKKGEYKQSFKLKREGLGAISPVVPT